MRMAPILSQDEIRSLPKPPGASYHPKFGWDDGTLKLVAAVEHILTERLKVEVEK